MALLIDWVKQNTSTTGTGVITLGTAFSNAFIRMQDDSRISDGSIVNYTIEDGDDRERGIGTYASSGTTLTRTLVKSTLVSGTLDDSSPTAINLSGGAIVSISAISETHNRLAALLKKTSDQSIIQDTNIFISWDDESYDDLDFHDNVTNNTRITIPYGVNKVKLSFSVAFSTSGTGRRIVVIAKNGSIIYDGVGYVNLKSSSAGPCRLLASTAILDVVSGDYFEGRVQHDAGSAIDVEANSETWFSIEVVG